MKNNEDLYTIKAEVEKITYQNKENGFTVARFYSGGETFTAVGKMPDLGEGESVELCGTYSTHDIYGPQFKVKSYARVLPGDLAAMKRYLSSGAVKGIGPVTARKIIEHFGEDTLRILEEEPLRLCEVNGISKEKAAQLGEEFSRRKSISTILAYFNTYGINPDESLKAFACFGQNTIECVKENPYYLCMPEIGVDFQRVDSIAARINSDYSTSKRIKSGIEYILQHNLLIGHTCLPEEKLLKVASNLLKVPNEELEEAIAQMKERGRLSVTMAGGDRHIALCECAECEGYIAARLQLIRTLPNFSDKPADKEIAAIEAQQGIRYAEQQKRAIRLAVESGILILTGGPGTGKTTTVNAIIQILENRGLTICLTAPTGRAAKRMQELCHREAQTVHRLLEVAFAGAQDKPVFGRNENNPLRCDVLIVDEMSMVDVKLFEAILRASKLSCKLILVGDFDQLPSVAPGNVLYDLIKSEKFPCVQLNEIFRQAQQSLIVTNAHRIINGTMPDLTQKDKDFFFLNCSGLSVTDTVVDLCCSRLPKAYGYSALQDIQVLCPTKITRYGTTTLNNRIQTRLNGDSSQPSMVLKDYTLRLGDKVMMTKNNYEIIWENAAGEKGTGVFNGDIGILSEIQLSTQTFKVQFEDKVATFIGEQIFQLELAYAITVHKSQGCEFPCVVLPVYGTPEKLCYRNLLYTAVTRARERIVLVGSEEIVKMMVDSNRKILRYSGLRDRLNKLDEE